MKRLFFKLGIALQSFFLAAPAMAACEDILRFVNYNRVDYQHALTAEQINTARFCSADYRSAGSADKSGIELSYAGYGFGLSNDSSRISQEQSRRCAGRFGSDFLATVQTYQEVTASRAALDAVAKCEEAKQGRFELESLTAVNRSFTASFRWRGTGDMAFSGVAITPHANGRPFAHCTTIAPGGGTLTGGSVIRPNEVFHVTCVQVPAQEPTDNPAEAVRLYPAGAVSVGIQSGQVTIPVAEYSEPLVRSSRISELEAANVALSAALTAVQARLAALEGRTYQARTSAPSRTGFFGPDRWRPCPPNQVLTEFQSGENHDFRLGCSALEIVPSDQPAGGQ